jgi:Spy/CpxP family protein refolding chaperone
LNYRLKYLAWFLPALTLLLTVSVSGHDAAQRGQPIRVSSQQAAAPAPAVVQGGPPRQGPPAPRPGSGWGEWWKDELVVKELQLSPQRARRIDNIFQLRSRRVAGVAEELPTEEKKLGLMAAAREVDESTFALQVARVSFLRSRAWESRQVMLYAMYLELSPEQHKKLVEIQERSRGRGRGSRGSNQ